MVFSPLSAAFFRLPSPRTPERRNGPCRVYAPFCSTETEDGKGQGGGERDELCHGPDDSSPRAASTVHFNLFDDGDVLAARPDRLYEVRPQPGVLRHTGAHFVGFSPFVQILDDPVPQMRGEQVVEFMRKLDAPALDEQVIAVPKISLDRVSKRFRRLRTRKADQLVEVPTIISYSSLQSRFMEQITLIFQFLTVVLEGEVFKASSQDRVQLLLHLTLVLRKKLGMGFFALFPGGKKCGVGSALGVRTGCGLYSMDSGGLCRVHGGRLRRGGGVGGGGGDCGGGGGGGRCDSLCCWFSAPAGLYAVPQAPVGMARAEVCLW